MRTQGDVAARVAALTYYVAGVSTRSSPAAEAYLHTGQQLPGTWPGFWPFMHNLGDLSGIFGAFASRQGGEVAKQSNLSSCQVMQHISKFLQKLLSFLQNTLPSGNCLEFSEILATFRELFNETRGSLREIQKPFRPKAK